MSCIFSLLLYRWFCTAISHDSFESPPSSDGADRPVSPSAPQCPIAVVRAQEAPLAVSPGPTLSECFDVPFRNPSETSSDGALFLIDVGAPTVSETDTAEPTATATVVPTVLAVPAAPDVRSRRTAQRRAFCTEQVVPRSRTLIVGTPALAKQAFTAPDETMPNTILAASVPSS